MIFQDLPPTTHIMRAETLYNYGSSATTDTWDAIFATYHTKSDFVCTEIMQLLKIFQTFDDSNFTDLQADINSLLDQIAVEQIGTRDLAVMSLVVGVNHAGREEPLFREAFYQIIWTKSINYVPIMPAKTPDCLLTVFAGIKDAVDVLLANPNYEPPARAYLVGNLGTVTGVKTKGCFGCPLHCIGRNSDDSAKCWRPTPMASSAKSGAGNHVHLALDGPSDSFSSRYDGLEDIDKCVLAGDCALNDTNLNPKIREEIRMVAHHGDHPRLAALFLQCKRAMHDTDT